MVHGDVVKQSAIALLLAILSVSAAADTQWLPSPVTLRGHMCAARSVVIGRLIDVSIEQTSRARLGSGRIAVDQVVTHSGTFIPTIKWSDRNEVTCPRLNIDQFKDRLGVWFIHRDASGAFDGYASEFWEIGTAKRILEQIEHSESLSPELEDLRRAIQLSGQVPAG